MQGGASGAPVKVFVHVKDARGKRLKEGGEDVVVRVQGLGAGAGGLLMVEMADNNDGTYTATYTPPTKGNYSVTVEINGVPIAGSPFPVFFSAPIDPATLAAEEAERAAAAAAAAPPAPAAPTEAARSITPPVTAAEAAANAAAAVADEQLRTLHVGNISPIVPLEKLRDLFAMLGVVVSMLPVTGAQKDLVTVVYATREAAAQATALHGTQFGDRPLRVTLPITVMASGIIPTDTQLAMQVQQIQQMQVGVALVA
jgi:hypothetical protein